MPAPPLIEPTGGGVAQELVVFESSSHKFDEQLDIGTTGYDNSKKTKLLSQENKRHLYLMLTQIWENTSPVQERFNLACIIL